MNGYLLEPQGHQAPITVKRRISAQMGSRLLQRISWRSRSSLQYTHRTRRQHLAEITGVERTAIDVERCLAAVAGIRKNVVDDQRATDVDPSGPAVEVALRGLFCVPTVDEQQLQWHSPTAGD